MVLRVKLIMDPLSKLAQSALPLIALLHRALNAQVLAQLAFPFDRQTWPHAVYGANPLAEFNYKH